MRFVHLTNQQAKVLLSFVRLFWHKDIYGALIAGTDAAQTATNIMMLNDSWGGLAIPIEIFVDMGGPQAQLVVSTPLYDRFVQLLAHEPLERDLPQVSSSDYLRVIVPMLRSWGELRRAFADADMVTPEEYTLLSKPSAYKN
jgi:hypothetical protein